MRIEATSVNPEVEALLTEAQLPVSDLSTCRSLNLLGIRESGRLVGVVGSHLCPASSTFMHKVLVADQMTDGQSPV
jgi:hypothetical protein